MTNVHWDTHSLAALHEQSIDLISHARRLREEFTELREASTVLRGESIQLRDESRKLRNVGAD